MKNKITTLLLASILLIQLSCNKQYDEPPVNDIPIGDIITISDLKDLFNGSPITIDSNYSIFGNVTCEETNGNFYKEVFMQDLSGAIKIKLKAYALEIRRNQVRT